MTRKGNHRRAQETDGPSATGTQARLAQTAAQRQAGQKLIQGPFGMGQVTQDEAKQAMEAGAWLSYQAAAVFSVVPAVFLTQHQQHLLDPLFGAPVVGGVSVAMNRLLAGLAILAWFIVPKAKDAGWRPYAVLLGWSLAVGPAVVKLIGGALLGLGPTPGVWAGRLILEGVTTLARWGWVLSVVNIGQESLQFLLPLTMIVPIILRQFKPHSSASAPDPDRQLVGVLAFVRVSFGVVALTWRSPSCPLPLGRHSATLPLCPSHAEQLTSPALGLTTWTSASL